jgi:type VI secretion system protein ImpA
VLDPAELITPLEAANPSGPNLEYDPAFQELERAQQGKPEQVMGGCIRPAEAPDWRDVGKRAEALLRRTHDLRVAITLTQARLETDGIAGLVLGLAVIKGLLETQWETVHPQLDADDNNDPTWRINTLQALVADDGIRKSLYSIPLVQSKALGRFNLRDFRIASGRQAALPNMENPPDQALIDAAFRDVDLESLKATVSQLTMACGHTGDIEALLVDKVRSDLKDLAWPLPDLWTLAHDLSEIKYVMTQQLGTRRLTTPTDGELTTVRGPASAARNTNFDAAAP